MTDRQPDAEEILRQQILTSGQSVYAIAKGSGVAQPVVHRFAAGEQGLTLRNAGKLLAYLGLEIRRREE